MSAYVVLPVADHTRLVALAFQARGYTAEEAASAAHWAGRAAWYGIRSHGAIKALHLDEILGSGVGGCRPGAAIEKIETGFPAAEKWDSHQKLGQPVAEEAMRTCMALADRYGVGIVAVDHAFHYLWGGGYVMDAAAKGYVAYTTCTAGLAEVVPFQGRYPTLGTNPHSWGLPTTAAVGFPIVIDWATSAVAMGKVQVHLREGKPLGQGWAVDAAGHPTVDPSKVAALLPFGGHKGYGLGLLTELVGGMIGGWLPTLRGRFGEGGEAKRSMSFFFQCWRPEILGAGTFADTAAQTENVRAVIADILGHGNDSALLPGELEHRAGQLSARHGGLLFTEKEIDGLGEEFARASVPFHPASLSRVEIAEPAPS